MPGSVVDLDELGAVDEARDTGRDSSMVLMIRQLPCFQGQVE